MKTKIQIKTLWGTLLYEHEAEDNSVKKTVEEVVKSGAYLYGAYLRCADLRGADLYGADLRCADLHGADLRGADLRGADLYGADLRCADLRGADLYGADLRCADLRCADLYGADLRCADLRCADLRCADLYGADLRGADLRCADLRGADLYGANLGEDWAKLSSASDVLVVGAIGSRDGYTTVYHTDKGIFVQCGCFRGTLDEFAAKVKETHAGTKHERDYNALIEFIKIKYSEYDVQND